MGSTFGRARRLTPAHTEALALALAQLHADPARPLTLDGCHGAVGAMLGLTACAVRDRLIAAGLSVTPRERGTVPCSRCSKPTREVLRWDTARQGECRRCQGRGRK